MKISWYINKSFVLEFSITSQLFKRKILKFKKEENLSLYSL